MSNIDYNHDIIVSPSFTSDTNTLRYYLLNIVVRYLAASIRGTQGSAGGTLIVPMLASIDGGGYDAITPDNFTYLEVKFLQTC